MDCSAFNDDAWADHGASAEIVVRVVERLQGQQTVRVGRMGFEHVPCPTTKNLENLFYPNPRTIAASAYALFHNGAKGWVPAPEEAPEIASFRGPF